jgi:hypothetical protein
LAMLLAKHANMLAIIQQYVLAFGRSAWKPHGWPCKKQLCGLRSLAKVGVKGRRHALMQASTIENKKSLWKPSSTTRLFCTKFDNKVILFQETLEYKDAINLCYDK